MAEAWGLYSQFDPEADYDQFMGDFTKADTSGDGYVDEMELLTVLGEEL